LTSSVELLSQVFQEFHHGILYLLVFVHLRRQPDQLSAPQFLHMQIVDSGLNFTINEKRFGFLQAGHVYLSPSHHFFSAGIETHIHLLAATIQIDSASS
jgi:hypothetical protein